MAAAAAAKMKSVAAAAAAAAAEMKNKGAVAVQKGLARDGLDPRARHIRLPPFY
jgi:hypothetical protein